MKKVILGLLALVLVLCPLLTLADGLYAEVVKSGETTQVRFTDEEGDTYLLTITQDGVEAVRVGEEKQETVVSDPCWRCGESLSSGDHTAGECGFKYHSACMDPYFSNVEGHVLCPICDSCMLSSGSMHGVGYGMCGAALLMEGTCKTCGVPYDEDLVHGGKTSMLSSCLKHCWIEDVPHAPCALCEKPLCNGEKHGKGECIK